MDPDDELNLSSSLNSLEHRITDIRLSMVQNLLKLNDDKSNIIYLGLPHYDKTLNGSLHKFGVIFDKSINI